MTARLHTVLAPMAGGASSLGPAPVVVGAQQAPAMPVVGAQQQQQQQPGFHQAQMFAPGGHLHSQTPAAMLQRPASLPPCRGLSPMRAVGPAVPSIWGHKSA